MKLLKDAWVVSWRQALNLHTGNTGNQFQFCASLRASIKTTDITLTPSDCLFGRTTEYLRLFWVQFVYGRPFCLSAFECKVNDAAFRRARHISGIV